jgi:hypothetical protein
MAQLVEQVEHGQHEIGDIGGTAAATAAAIIGAMRIVLEQRLDLAAVEPDALAHRTEIEVDALHALALEHAAAGRTADGGPELGLLEDGRVKGLCREIAQVRERLDVLARQPQAAAAVAEMADMALGLMDGQRAGVVGAGEGHGAVRSGATGRNMRLRRRLIAVAKPGNQALRHAAEQSGNRGDDDQQEGRNGAEHRPCTRLGTSKRIRIAVQADVSADDQSERSGHAPAVSRHRGSRRQDDLRGKKPRTAVVGLELAGHPVRYSPAECSEHDSG